MENLQEPVSRVPLLSGVFNKYKLKVEALSKAFKRAKKYLQTAELVALDYDRDGLTMRTIHIIKDAAAHPLNEEEKAAADKLMPIVENYLGADRQEYESNSAYLSHFVKELKAPANSQALTTLNLLPIVTGAETKNNTFHVKYTDRMEEMEKNRTEGTTRDFFNEATKSLIEFTEAVTGMQRLQIDASTTANLNEITFKLNALIDQYTLIYHRHAGIIARHNNGGNGDGEGDGFETPDIDNPDITNPENPENPDIENPPPPPFLPDFE
ncbi:hypothetical protein FACS189438_0890 [Bacteroidia bacterium]|nr:hypothetical protein FACS189438_0890 [Bacteroidia bacterium]